ncbi:MAG: carboxypeptidase-like regulatory domain-containing protein [Planctomycetota bacterium]
MARLALAAALLFAAATLVVLLVLSGRDEEGPPAVPAVPEGTTRGAPAPPIAGAEAPPEPAARTELGGSLPDAAPEGARQPGPVPGTTVVVVHGRVLDVNGEPLAGVPVASGAAPRRPLAETDAEGRFAVELPLIGGQGELTVIAGRYAAVRDCQVRAEESGLEAILVAAAAIDLGGLVVDAGGVAVAGAGVTIAFHYDDLHGFPLPLDRSLSPRWLWMAWDVTTDGEGRFRIERAPSVPEATIQAHHDQQGYAQLPLPATSRQDLLFTLTRRPGPPGRIEGVVLLPDGTPAAGATVACGSLATTSGPDGRFSFSLGREVPEELALSASAEGHGTVVRPRFGVLVREWWPDPPPPATLVLGVAPLEIAGRVEDAEGQPLANWRVYLHDETRLDETTVARIAEKLAGGQIESTTDGEGAFRLTGLLDRDYVLRAYDPRTLLSVQSPPIRAGTPDARIVVPAGGTMDLLRGVVVARDRSAVAGVRVRVEMVRREFSPRTQFFVTGAEAFTDEQGTFVLRDVPRTMVGLEVSGPRIMPLRRPVDPAGATGPLVIEVARRCHFRLHPRGSPSAEARIELLDARNEALLLYRFDAGTWRAASQPDLAEAATGVHSVAEDAVTLRVLRRTGQSAPWEETSRRPIVLDPNRVNEIEVELP